MEISPSLKNIIIFTCQAWNSYNSRDEEDKMRITSISDLKDVFAKMHDSEFTENDFKYNPDENKFILLTHIITMQGKIIQTRAPIQSGKRFRLELLNIVKYKSNLGQLIVGKSTFGVFDHVRIRDAGKKLTIISQDLRIELELDQLAGNFDEI